MRRFFDWLDSLILSFMGRYYKPDGQILPSPSLPEPMPTPPPAAPELPSTPVPAPTPAQVGTLRWETPRKAYHSVRVICDQEDLTFNQKEILSGCVMQESGFLTNPKPNVNYDKAGRAWSTDYGIVQVNDYWHIKGHGPGTDFPSVEYVLTHPESCVRWMARIMKQTGALKQWSSYTTGAYKKHLLPNSGMRKLAL